MGRQILLEKQIDLLYFLPSAHAEILSTLLLELVLALTGLQATLSHTQAQTTPTAHEVLPIQQITETIGEPQSLPLTQGAIRTIIVAKAREMGVSELIALEIADKESRFNPLAVGDKHLICKKTGKRIRSRGIWQINSCAWPEVTDEIAFSVEKSTAWAMPKIKETPEIWSVYKLISKK